LIAPPASSIPLAALAAILFVVACNMSEVKHFFYLLRRASVGDRVILVTTLLLTVLADLVVAVNVGVIFAMMRVLRRMASTVKAQPIDARSLRVELADLGVKELPRGVLVYEIAGPIFFAAVENFERAMRETHSLPKTLILRLQRVPFMDITGILTLEEVMTELHRRGVRVILCEANNRVLSKLRTAGALAEKDVDDHRPSLREALQSAGIGPMGAVATVGRQAGG